MYRSYSIAAQIAAVPALAACNSAFGGCEAVCSAALVAVILMVCKTFHKTVWNWWLKWEENFAMSIDWNLSKIRVKISFYKGQIHFNVLQKYECWKISEM